MEAIKGSGSKAASALIDTGDGMFCGIIVATDATNAVTLDVYDGVAAAGVKLIPTTVIPSSATDRVRMIPIPGGAVRYYDGLYVNASVGAGAFSYVAYFQDED
jgi:hypothetical protein